MDNSETLAQPERKLTEKYYEKHVCSLCNGKYTFYNYKKHCTTAKHTRKANEQAASVLYDN